ncbi:MAG TPA: hypothetical protein VNO32_59800, partial [Candidatus Acidoferrum sp.]|nr:hypothetical protein [Candidatus Acidoferrum sp.]
MGGILIIFALAIARLAMGINAQVGWHFETTPLAGATFAGLSIAADMLAIVLPSNAVAQIKQVELESDRGSICSLDCSNSVGRNDAEVHVPKVCAELMERRPRLGPQPSCQ